MKMKIQIGIVALAFFVLIYGAVQILEMPTMILPSWFILILLVGVVFSVATGIAFLIKTLLKSDWNLFTFTVIIMAVFCIGYLALTYKPSCKIVVDANYTGEAKLFVSKHGMNNEDKVILNRYGVGYISKEKFDKGFYPIVIQGGKDITKKIQEYRKNTFTSTSLNQKSFDYLSFDIPGKSDIPMKSVDDLIKLDAVDTTLAQE